MYDVVIVGAGAAGASAAYFLNNSGGKVLVLEKQGIPRYKVCGGGLSLQFLRQQFPFSFEAVIEQDVQEIYYHCRGKKFSIPIESERMGMVMRSRFDEHILSHAACEIRPQTTVRRIYEEKDRVRVTTSDGDAIQTRYLIGADGATSLVRRMSGIASQLRQIPAVEVEVPINAGNRHLSKGPHFIFEGPRYGYLWIFPKGENLSIGIANFRCQKFNMQRVLCDIMRQKSLSLENCEFRGHTIPLYHPGGRFSSQRILLIGDAAGLADPLSGEGIRPAILSGKMAAEAILHESTDAYASRVRSSLGMKLSTSLLTSKIFYPLRDLCILLGAPNPISTNVVLDALSNKGSNLRVMGLSLLSLPYFVFIEIMAHFLAQLAGDSAAGNFKNRIYPGCSNTTGR